MSAIFRSAAMTLLSKTLQTLLYKYLSDVDVEGVALPSLLPYNSDGHSGWGVRLSNVKLREGAKLLDLPGTSRRRRRKRRRQRQTRQQRRQPNEKQSTENDEENNENESLFSSSLDEQYATRRTTNTSNETRNDTKRVVVGSEAVVSNCAKMSKNSHQQEQQHDVILLGSIAAVSHNNNNNNKVDNENDDDDPEVRIARAAALAAAAAASESSSTSKRKGWFGSWYSSSSSVDIQQQQHDEETTMPDGVESSEEAQQAERSLQIAHNAMAEEENDEEETLQSSSFHETRIKNNPVDGGDDEALLPPSFTPNDASTSTQRTFYSSSEAFASNDANEEQQQQEEYPSMTAAAAKRSQTDPGVATDAASLAAQSRNELASSSLSSSPRRRSWFGYFYSAMGPLEEQQVQASPPLLKKHQSLPITTTTTDSSGMTTAVAQASSSSTTTSTRDNIITTTTRAQTTSTVNGNALVQPEDTSESSSYSSTILEKTPKRKASSATSATAASTFATDALLTPKTNNNSKKSGLVKDSSSIKEGDNEHDGDSNGDGDEDYYYEDDDDEEDDDNDEQAGDDYEDFFEEIVAPMILRLGPSGRIGTLDVRLVGKDIHVLVEDADLLVEVVRPPPKNKEDDALGSGGGGDASSTPEKKSKTTEIKKKLPLPEPKTVGDRVMAENTIARAFSAIPNLLLRDIRVRLVVRDDDDEPQNDQPQNDDNDNNAALPESKPVQEKEKSPSTASSGGSNTRSASSETVFEVCIELMSVTADGQDFFAHFRRDDEDDSSEAMDAEEDEMDESRNVVSTSGLDGDNQTIQENEYLTKRIRTGRGPDGGITIRAFPGGISDHFISASRDDEWSRYTWLSFTEFCVLRCSGLDIHARMFMGTRQEVRHSTSSVFWYNNEEYDADFSVDSMLFGVDYIAPGPQPPLPPIEEQTDLGAEEDGQLWMIPGATTYQLDVNGIQSSRVGSSFHRVARGMIPTVCRCDHLPCEYCAKCWEAVPGTCLEHKLDDSAPMGGLVLNVSIRDRLEFNVDRPSLESIGLLLSLFTKKDASEEEVKLEPGTEDDLDAESISISGLDISEASAGARSLSSRNNSARGLKARASSSGLDQGSKQFRTNDRSASSLGDQGSRPLRKSGSKSGSLAVDQERGPPPKPNDVIDHAPPDEAVHAKETDKFDITDAFPSYMQPEKVQYIGVNISEVVFRIHLMRERTVEDHRLSFRFWSILVKCLTVDHQQFVSPERSFQDIRCDFGHFSADEYRGVERKQLASLGLRQRVVDFDEITVETLMTREADCKRPPWPSTASVLLDLPPPVESLLYETRDRHAIQLRFVCIHEAGGASDFSRSSVHIKLGATFMDVPSYIGSQISTVISEAKRSITGPPPLIDASPGNSAVEVKPVDSLMKYSIQLDGARVSLQQFVDVRIPLTTVVGERSSTAGLSFQTVLEHLNLKYGNTATPSLFSDRRLSLEHLAELPDNVRLRILLFLDNLNPLARAFGIKMEEENSFLLCGAINKAIIKISRKARRKSQTASGEDPEGISRRQEIMSELLRLDDDDLEDLWETHRRNQRRAARQKTKF